MEPHTDSYDEDGPFPYIEGLIALRHGRLEILAEPEVPRALGLPENTFLSLRKNGAGPRAIVIGKRRFSTRLPP